VSAADELPDALALRCPKCGRSAGTTPLYRVATRVVRRTCRGCRRRWVVVLTPLRAAAGLAVTRADWQEVPA